LLEAGLLSGWTITLGCLAFVGNGALRHRNEVEWRTPAKAPVATGGDSASPPALVLIFLEGAYLSVLCFRNTFRCDKFRGFGQISD
jgi:hypothetical protein